MTLDSKRKVLVTGATGLLGNNLTRLLLQRKVQVRALVRQDADPRPLDGLRVEIVRGDVRDPEAVAKACRGMDLVFHAAAMVKIGGRNPQLYREVNGSGTRNVVEAMMGNQARLVHVSTTDTIGCHSLRKPADESSPFDDSHATPYSISKREAEGIVLEAAAAGLNAVIVNPSFMLGPWDWKPSSGAMLCAVGRGLGWFAPRGYGSFVDVRDVAEATLSAAEKGLSGNRYILAGESLSYLEAWRMFAEISGRPRPLCQLGPVASFVSGLAGDGIALLSGREPSVNSTALRAANCPRNYSSTKAERELGFTRRPLRKTVEDAWAWFQKTKKMRPGTSTGSHQ